MFIQSDKPNEWWIALEWQNKLINMAPNFYLTDIQIDQFYGDRGQTIVNHDDFTYVLYYKYGDYQGYDIPILLNLNTGKSRLVDTVKNHNGAIIDTETSEQFLKLLCEKEIPDI